MSKFLLRKGSLEILGLHHKKYLELGGGGVPAAHVVKIRAPLSWRGGHLCNLQVVVLLHSEKRGPPLPPSWFLCLWFHFRASL